MGYGGYGTYDSSSVKEVEVPVRVKLTVDCCQHPNDRIRREAIQKIKGRLSRQELEALGIHDYEL